MAPISSTNDYSPKTPTRAGISKHADRFALLRYQLLRELLPWHEEAGSAPIPIDDLRSRRKDEVDSCTTSVERKVAQARYQSAVQRAPTLWLAKRRKDGKLFLAQEINSELEIKDQTLETLLRLLNHPNLVSLADIQKDRSCNGRRMDFTVWDYCDKGTLNRLLWCAPGQERIEIPESLCWHVLDGLTQALLWLHYGRKETFPFGCHTDHDEDWHPLLMTDISPANIYFCSPERDETYGLVKLGNFATASVMSDIETAEVRVPLSSSGKYQPPELRNDTQRWDMKSDIWSLAAVVYHMMVGIPPVDTEPDDLVPQREGIAHHHLVKALPNRYSKALRGIMKDMLHFKPKKRPTTADLSRRVRAEFKVWRETTKEGRDIVGRGETRGEREVSTS